MIYSELGKTGIKVSKLCFGSLTLGPLQKNLSVEEGAAVIRRAAEMGVNFIDTADLYGTYPYIREILKDFPDMVVSSKSYAYDIKTAEETLNRALAGISRDYIDCFLLHEQEGPLTLKGHWEAIEYLSRCKNKGLVRAIGISTHHVAGVRAAAEIPEIDIIHPIINYRGVGIVDGDLEDMEQAISLAWSKGKGIYAMKALGGGHLIPDLQKAFDYILNFPYLHSVAVGMQMTEEVEINVDIFNGIIPNKDKLDSVRYYERKLFIQDWCTGCGRCIRRCQQGALIIGEDGKSQVDGNKCILCGYCGSVCKELAIKVI
ncbi:MAG: 4Fe-4S binding protein [Clostridiales bacterium]|nr:4Fe-4S binding protein [Clostridiales bacterium]